jgi:WD40 repeat protein
VNSVAFSWDGLCAISGSDDKTIRIWDVSTGKQLQQLDGHNNWVRSVAFSSDGSHAISGSDDRTIRIWDISTGKQLQQLDGHDNGVNSVALLSDGSHAISGSNDKTIRTWQVPLPGNYHVLFTPSSSDIPRFIKDRLAPGPQRVDHLIHEQEVDLAPLRHASFPQYS